MHGNSDRANFPAALASCVRRLAASLGLTLFCIATAWAGRGDIDPNYGEGGRVATEWPRVLLALPDDRLMIAEPTGEGLRIRIVDAAGQNDPTFGDGGVALIDSSAAARTFQPGTAAFAPNGDMIFVGSLSETGAPGLLRLDNDGQPVASFGNRGDGIVESALTTNGTIALAVDPDGKIVVVEGSWNHDFSTCRRTARMQRLLANGQPDVEFGADGLIEIQNLELCRGTPVFGARADGSIIVGDGHTIIAIDSAGEIDPTFGVDGRLGASELTWMRGLLLPDGGLLIFGSNDEAASSNDTLFLKFDRNGQPNLDYGAGTGSVTVNLGAALLGVPVSSEYVDQLALDPDGEHIVAQLSVSHADGSLACSGIARLSMDGTPDAGFGRNGLACLNVNSTLVAVQSDQAPLFFAEDDGAIHRLLSDSSPSPGLLTVVVADLALGESEGTATVTIERIAGHDGAVSAGFTTTGRQAPYKCFVFGGVGGDSYETVCWSGGATASFDYTATSGRLDWADGDDGQRTVTVTILDDDIYENAEAVGVDFSEPGGGIQLIGASAAVVIFDDDEMIIDDDDDDTASGGGGSVSSATALALLTLLFIRRRQTRRATAG